MWKSRLLYLIGTWIIFLSCVQLIPLVYASITGEARAFNSLFASTILSLLLGGALFLGFRSTERVRVPRLTVFLPLTGILVLAMIAGLPLFFMFPDRGFVAAVYDGMSQITTNGSSAYEGEIDVMPSILLWRSLTSWIGGLMAVGFALSLLMAMNSGGMQLHRSPLNFGDSETGYIRLRATIKSILPIYAAVTIICFSLIAISGKSIFNAFLLALSVISTSGTIPDSMVQNQNMLTQLVLSIFLVIGLSNWDFHYLRVKSRTTSWRKDRELRISVLLIVTATLFIFTVTGFNFSNFVSFLFASTSALATYGIMPETIPTEGDLLLPISLGLMMLAGIGGGVAGTTGGLKQMRFLTIAKLGKAEVDRLAHPHGIHTVKYGNVTAERGDVDAVWLLLGSFILIAAIGAIAFAVLGIDFQSALTLSFTAMTLSGPLIASADPAFAGYSSLADADYAILTVLMLVGRVEASLFMAILAKSLWRG
ncbi:potassium transporter TrkG [Kordiimonas aquimaris]|uniref:potassium transporter TrkG n=1 Tax=Kordiimonas aquimaris TaxID=707591 RepID=UPI0021D0E3B0|nr:potassium transporter TrkG [Kordiimonas aquimaris]